MRRIFEMTAGSRAVRIPFTYHPERERIEIPFTFGQREIRVPVALLEPGARRVLRMVYRQTPMYMPLVITLPDNTEIRIMRIGDLDSITIGTLDPFPVPDER